MWTVYSQAVASCKEIDLNFLVQIFAAYAQAAGTGQELFFVFGDSYADTGNIPRTGPFAGADWLYPYGITWPGYPDGRFCDGKLQTDWLGKNAELSNLVLPLLCGWSHLNLPMFTLQSRSWLKDSNPNHSQLTQLGALRWLSKNRCVEQRVFEDLFCCCCCCCCSGVARDSDSSAISELNRSINSKWSELRNCWQWCDFCLWRKSIGWSSWQSRALPPHRSLLQGSSSKLGNSCLGEWQWLHCLQRQHFHRLHSMLQYTYKKYKCWEAAAALESSLSFETFLFLNSVFNSVICCVCCAGEGGVHRVRGARNCSQFTEIVWFWSPRCDGIEPTPRKLYSRLHAAI